MRQPYGRDIASTVVYAHPVWFARHGYNVVIQDVRGRGDSEGEFYPFRNEGRDGAETIAWLRTRPESNGRIGMYGFSYQGMTQLLAAAEQPEGLVCIAPGMTAHDLYHGWFYHQGALRFASSSGLGYSASERGRATPETSRGKRPARSRPGPTSRRKPACFPSARTPRCKAKAFRPTSSTGSITTKPGDYWAALDVSRTVHKIGVPALHISGWYDIFSQGSIDGFLALCEHAASELARENQYLIAGPWIHIPWGDRIGAADFGARLCSTPTRSCFAGSIIG